MAGAHDAPKKRKTAAHDIAPEPVPPRRGRHEPVQRRSESGEKGRRKEPKRHGAWFVPVISLLCVLLAVAVFCGGFVYHVAALDTIYPNVRLQGVNVGGQTRAAALARLEQEAPEGYAGKSVTVSLPMGESLTVSAEQIGLGGTRETALALAYGYGRGGNAVENALSYLRCLRGHGVDILWEGSGINFAALSACTGEAAAQVNEKLANADIEITDESITLIKGAGTAHAEGAELAALIQNAFLRRDYAALDYEPQLVGGDRTDLQALYDRVYVQAQNAAYDKQTESVSDSVTGVSFDIEQAEALLAEASAGDAVTIALEFTEPDITADAMRENMFRDLLAEKSTSLSGSSSARIINITLAAEAMNGTVLLPGEEFNYNECLGERTAEKGYQGAGAYSGGKHVTSIGGGICQGSSTLYYCALKANLEITARTAHYFTVSYLPMGMDATVSWGWPEFNFVNSRDWPIRIDAWVDGGELHVQLWGTDVDGSYVEITADGWEDAENYYAQTYRNVYAADGTLIRSTPEAYSSYAKYEAEDDE